MTSGNYLADPMGIAITDDGTVLVSDCEKGCIQMFDDSGKYLGKFGRVDASRLSHPAGELRACSIGCTRTVLTLSIMKMCTFLVKVVSHSYSYIPSPNLQQEFG